MLKRAPTVPVCETEDHFLTCELFTCTAGGWFPLQNVSVRLIGTAGHEARVVFGSMSVHLSSALLIQRGNQDQRQHIPIAVFAQFVLLGHAVPFPR